MNKLLVVLNAVLLLAGCASTPESLTEDLINESDKLVELLGKVVDLETAEQHKAQIQSLGFKYKILFKDWKKAMENLGEGEKKEFKKQFEEPMRKVTTKLVQQVLRLSAAPYGKDLMGSWWDGKEKTAP